MFDIGFPEMMLVAVVALLIIGPDKLPEAMRSVALWVGRFRRSMAGLRSEIEREIGADDIRRQLHNEAIMKELEATRQELSNMTHDTHQALADIKQPLRKRPVTDQERIGDPERERVTETTLQQPVPETVAPSLPEPTAALPAASQDDPADDQRAHDRHP